MNTRLVDHLVTIAVANRLDATAPTELLAAADRLGQQLTDLTPTPTVYTWQPVTALLSPELPRTQVQHLEALRTAYVTACNTHPDWLNSPAHHYTTHLATTLQQHLTPPALAADRPNQQPK